MSNTQISTAKKLLCTFGAVLIAANTLVACSKQSSTQTKTDDKPNTEEKAKETQKLKGVIPQSQLDALKKSKSVEDTLKEAEEKRRKELNRL